MGIRINFGSGQRAFGLPRTAEGKCVICGRDGNFHEQRAGGGLFYYPKSSEAVLDIHQYVPESPDAWVNIDCQERWKPDAINLSVIPEGSAEIIVSHHQLEHVELSAADDLIREWHRCLEPGGSLLVFVPDMRAIATAWLEGRIDDYIFSVNTWGAWMGDASADIHRWGYWGPSLKKKLNAACRWSMVRPFDWRVIPGADLACDWWILAVEAIK